LIENNLFINQFKEDIMKKKAVSKEKSEKGVQAKDVDEYLAQVPE
jgi:hypothetical protein